MDLFVVLPPFPQQKIFLGVVLAYKRGTDRNTKTTTTTTTTTNTKKTFTAHATLPKGSATLQNLRIPILLLKTIDFPTFKT